jgi:hypothetical protein
MNLSSEIVISQFRQVVEHLAKELNYVRQEKPVQSQLERLFAMYKEAKAMEEHTGGQDGDDEDSGAEEDEEPMAGRDEIQTGKRKFRKATIEKFKEDGFYDLFDAA